MQRWLEVRVPFFRPLWRRILTVAFTATWAVFELTQGAWFWGCLAGGAAVYLAWAFFIAFEDGSHG